MCSSLIASDKQELNNMALLAESPVFLSLPCKQIVEWLQTEIGTTSITFANNVDPFKYVIKVI